jgi:pimeloyl-ACP methyl ester carboxylesterase
LSLHVERLGDGPPVLLVHGSVTGARLTWREQLPLAERWTLLLADRPGFGESPSLARCNFEAEAPLLADLLDEPAHVVAHSYGGVIALLAAALRPDGVRSLTVVEPPAFGVARGDPAVEAFVARGLDLWTEGPDDPAAFLERFFGLVGSRPIPGRLKPELEQGARLLMRERYPWEAQIPFDELAAAPFPKLAVSGAHDDAFEAVCDVLAERIGAERAVITGQGHGVQRAGAPFNGRLEEFLAAAEPG